MAQPQQSDEHLPMRNVTPTPTSDEPAEAYSVFSPATKWLICGIGALCAILSPISSNIFVPAIPTLSQVFHKSEEDITLCVTVYLIFQAFTPSLFGSASDSIGRRPVYIGTMVIYLGSNIGLALCPTSAYWLLLVLRMLQATGGSAVIAIGAGAISDVAEPRERGKYFGVFQAGLILGPAFGPLLGGVLAGTLGWRSIFWFLCIATGVALLPVVFLLPESLRSIVGNGSLSPPLLNASPQTCIRRRKERKRGGDSKTAVTRPPKKPYQPWSGFLVLLTPEILLVNIVVSFLYLEFYCILSLYSTVLKDVYGFNDIIVGACYIPSGVASVIASLVNGRQIDWLYRKEESRAGGGFAQKGEEFRLERARLYALIPFAVLFLISATALGWCLEAHAPLAATLVVNFFVGAGTGTIGTATVYAQDLKPGQGGAVSASLNLIRCVFAAVGTAVVQILYRAIGAGWTITLFSGITLVSSPLLYIVTTRGKHWRQKRAEKDKR